MAIGASTFSQFNPKITSNAQGHASITNVQTAPYSNDSLVLGNKPKEKSNAGWWIAGGVLAALGIGAMIMRGRMSAVKELAEHIDFKPAQTIDEARAFAKEHLGIRKFMIDDLEVANFLNGAFSDAANKTKGKIKLPDIVKIKTNNNAAAAVRGCLFSKDKIMYFDPTDVPSWNFIQNNPKLYKAWEDMKQLYGAEYMQKVTRLLKGNFTERSKAYQNMLQLFGYHADGGVYKTVFHELGHLEHEKQSRKMWSALFRKSFEGNTDEINIARKVSDYATEGPQEFVAEVFSDLLNGKKYSQDIMDLYNKYGGPKIPA